jgi:PHD/YefM family antitoxin component YafN of YafNO toxin-antitoxin module
MRFHVTPTVTGPPDDYADQLREATHEVLSMPDIVERLRAGFMLEQLAVNPPNPILLDAVEEAALEIEHLREEVATWRDLRAALAAEIERLTEAHEQIVEWSHAYPLAIFHLKRTHELLKAGGMTLDAISAEAMRHVIEQVAKISRAALDEGLPTADDVRGILR